MKLGGNKRKKEGENRQKGSKGAVVMKGEVKEWREKQMEEGIEREG